MIEVTKRGRPRQLSADDIKAAARRIYAAEGAEALTLRRIAAEMKITAPALYLYFVTRDDLITALIVDGFNGLADAVEQAVAGVSTDDPSARLWAALWAYRSWTVAHPAEYALIYGNPIPGFHAPPEITVPAASRNLFIIGGILQQAHEIGILRVPAAYRTLPPQTKAFFEALRQRDGIPLTDDVLAATAFLWARGHGMLMLELFRHIQPLVGDVEPLYAAELRLIFHEFGLTPPAEMRSVGQSE